MGAERGNQLVTKLVQGFFFIKSLRKRVIKMAVMKDEPQTLEGVLSELKWKVRFEARNEYEDELMEICHS